MYFIVLIIKHKSCFDIVGLAYNGGLAAVVIESHFDITATFSVQVYFETRAESLRQDWSRWCFQNNIKY